MSMRFLAGIAVAAALAAPDQGRAECIPGVATVVAVDRATYFQAALNAADFARRSGLPAVAIPFATSGDRKAFYKQIKALKPQIVVAHFSMFAPGDTSRGQFIDEFFAELETSNPPPLKYIIYSSAFAPKGQLTPAKLRDELHRLTEIDEARIGLVPVGTPYADRFSPGHGDKLLAAELKGFRELICK